MEAVLKDATHRQRAEIAKLLHAPLAHLAQQCVSVWSDRERLNGVLVGCCPKIPHCAYIYALDPSGVQVSDNVGPQGVKGGDFGKDRSSRPYLHEPMPEWGFLLSDAYVTEKSQRPSLTGLHVVTTQGQLLGFLAADFDLRDLPITGMLYRESQQWQQIKGDPSIRQLLFQQTRTESPMDRNIDKALAILGELLTERGVFQCVVHFSSSRATVWTIGDPYRYRMLDAEALEDPDICLAYPRRSYPNDALIPVSSIATILQDLRGLRFLDETLYLRVASINLFNGMVGLTFSCDGSHYMRYDEFLEKNLSFWIGTAA